MRPEMRASPGWFSVSLLLLAACAGREEPRLVPLPPQRSLVAAPGLPHEPSFVEMAEGRSDRSVIRGIFGEGAERWTDPNPAMRFELPSPGAWTAAVRFRAAETTLKDTGPITLHFFVNGRATGQMRVATADVRTFSAPVMLDGTDAELSFTVDKPWVSPQDGVKLGVVLQAMGFKRP